MVAWLNKTPLDDRVAGRLRRCGASTREKSEDGKAEGLDTWSCVSAGLMAGPNKLDPAKVVEAVVAGGRGKDGTKTG